jgi:hypothetical protein
MIGIHQRQKEKEGNLDSHMNLDKKRTNSIVAGHIATLSKTIYDPVNDR